MKRISLIWIITVFISCATAPTPDLISDQKGGYPFPGAYRVIRTVLNNGLRLLVIEDHSSPTFAYQTWFKVGSRNEISGKTGLAHLFEHLMFKETKTLKDGEFDRILEGAGAEGENAFTSRDYTAYIQELPASQLELIMKAEADRMKNVIVNDNSFKTEREVVQNERRFRNENNPDGLMDQALFELAFQAHPYHWPVIGYQEDLNQMSAQDAADFYKANYSPNHATVIIVGDVKANEVTALAKKYYGELDPAKTPTQTIAAEPQQLEPREKQLKLNIQVEKLLMGYKIPAFNHEDMPVLDVIQSLLTGGKNNRLNDALVETGFASAVGSDDFEDKDPSLYVIMVNLQKGKRATDAEQIILKELKKLTLKPVSDSELERAKNKLQFSFYQNLESNYEKAYFLGTYETLGGDFNFGLENIAKIQKVTAEDIQKVTNKYFQPNSRSVIIGAVK